MFLLKFTILIVFVYISHGSFVTYISKTEIPELEYINASVDPCDDFYEYACGNFKNVNPRPQRYEFWDHYAILQVKLHELMQVILKSKAKPDDPVSLKKAKSAYKACTDLEYSDKLNVPEVVILEDTGKWPLISGSSLHSSDFSWNIVGDLIAEFGVPLFFTIQVMPNLENATENIIYISKDPVLLPSIHPPIKDSSEDFLNVQTSKRGKHPFELFLAKIAFHLKKQIGSFKDDEVIVQEISEILAFMREVQKGGINDGKYNATTYTTTVGGLQKWTNEEFGKEINLNWLEYLNRVFGKSGVKVTPLSTLMVMDISLLYGVLNLIKQTKEEMLKNFLMSRLFTFTASDSNNVMREAFQQFRADMGDVLFTRPEYCTRKILDYPNGIGLSMALTYEYQRYHFDVNKINIAVDMINDLNDSFVDILHESEWLDEETRTNALIKVGKLITLLAYPDFVQNPRLLDKYYENLRICSWDHFGNAQRLRAFQLASNLALLGDRNREVWQLSPLVTNAYYNGQNNRILFPVSMLNPVFYTGSISSLDYGRIGAIIGHEITHGFDSQGMFYDGEGTVSMWTTPETYAKFIQRTSCFVEQYGKYYIPEIDQYVNADNTLRENIADNGGLREAFKAFQKLKQRGNIQATEEYTPEQLFFIGFGTMWCTEQTDAYLLKVQKGNHAPARYRVIGSLVNNKEFSEAFNCPAGTKMNPEDKCILW